MLIQAARQTGRRDGGQRDQFVSLGQRPIPKGGNKLLTGSSYATGSSSPLQAVCFVQLWAPGLLCWLSVGHMTAAPPEPVC